MRVTITSTPLAAGGKFGAATPERTRIGSVVESTGAASKHPLDTEAATMNRRILREPFTADMHAKPAGVL
jgi:hypothetical protein